MRLELNEFLLLDTHQTAVLIRHEIEYTVDCGSIVEGPFQGP